MKPARAGGLRLPVLVGALALPACGGVSNFGNAPGGVYLTCPSGSAFDVVGVFWSDERCVSEAPSTIGVETACAEVVARDACSGGPDAATTIEDALRDTVVFRARTDALDAVRAQRAYCFGANEVPWNQDVVYGGTLSSAPSSGTWEVDVDFTQAEQPFRQAPIRGTVSLEPCGAVTPPPADTDDTDLP